MRRPGLSRPALIPFLPVLAVQGHRVKKHTPRLSEAKSRQGERVGRDPMLRIAVVGDSVAAGIGVDDHDRTMAGQLADRISARTGRATRWDVVARSGADAREVAGLLATPDAQAILRRADVAIVSAGVNDTKNLNSDRQWTDGVAAVLDRIADARPDCRVVLLGLPPVERFPALPRPLAQLMGARARRLNAVAVETVRGRSGVVRLELDAADMDARAEPFATDGFHPGAELHALIAERADALIG